MGILRSLFTGRPDPVLTGALDADPAEAFSLHAGDVETAAAISVPADAFGLGVPGFTPGAAARVNRREAMQVPAFRHATDLVSVLGTMPLVHMKKDLTLAERSWLDQPERDVPAVVTMARLVTDLAHEGIAWWRITAFDWYGFPAYVERLDPRTVDVMPDERVRVTTTGKRGTAVEWPTDAELIRFEMPGNGWLTDGARAIRQCLILDAAAQRYAEGAPPGDYFTVADGETEAPFEDEDETKAFLTGWKGARQQRSTAWVPPGIKYVPNGINPEQLELAEQRQHAVLEIARVTGIDAEELGVSTTSRSYFNGFDRDKAYVSRTLGMFRAVIEGRLSMPAVTPRGDRVRIDVDGLLATDALTRYQTYAAGVAVGAVDPAEIRPAEGKPALPAAAKPAAALAPEPDPAPQQVEPAQPDNQPDPTPQEIP